MADGIASTLSLKRRDVTKVLGALAELGVCRPGRSRPGCRAGAFRGATLPVVARGRLQAEGRGPGRWPQLGAVVFPVSRGVRVVPRTSAAAAAAGLAHAPA